ncbi:unnamed protein product, partial [Brachionus calyciflorus]
MKLFGLFLIILFENSLGLDPTEPYPLSRTLQQPDLFKLFWKYDSTEITFEIHYKNSSKWALFGLGGSNFSDVVVTWLNQDQIGHFSDRYLLPNKQLLLDSETNWMPLDAFTKEGFHVFKFKRFIKVSCKSNSNEDLNIEPGTIQLVFATGNDLVPDVIDNLNRVEITVLNEKDAPFSCPLIPPKQELNSTPTEMYTNTFELIPGVYKLFWNYTDKDLIAEIHCKTNGWVGFGLSPNGGMDNSDVII